MVAHFHLLEPPPIEGRILLYKKLLKACLGLCGGCFTSVCGCVSWMELDNCYYSFSYWVWFQLCSKKQAGVTSWLGTSVLPDTASFDRAARSPLFSQLCVIPLLLYRAAQFTWDCGWHSINDPCEGMRRIPSYLWLGLYPLWIPKVGQHEPRFFMNYFYSTFLS